MPAAPPAYWIGSVPPAPDRPPPAGDLTADVVVVGAGIVGLSTARELARAGCDVVVLEADRIGSGVTGHTTGKVTSLHGLCYGRLRREHGAEAAGLYADAQEDALRTVERLCAGFEDDAELEHLPAFTYTTETGRIPDITAEAAAASAAGLPAAMVATSADTGLPYPVAAAVRVENQLQFHPGRFLAGLAADVTAHGGRIHEHTRVTELHDGAECRLTTEDGHTVHARDVVLATQYPLRCHSTLLVKLGVRRELVLAAPVPADRAPRGMYLAPELSTRSVRTAPLDGNRRLLIVAGESHPPGTGGVRERFARLEAWARRSFPALGAGPLPYRWTAQDVTTPDGLPYVGHEHPDTQHVYVATGFDGWGLSNGVMAGRLVTAHVTGAPRPAWTELFDPRRRLPWRDVPAVARSQVATGRHFLAGLTGGRSGGTAPGPEAGAGAAGPGTVGGRPRCTHMGCELGWDDAEETWECPCHGSRFAADGRVLQGPATRPLGTE
ncbi:FAD-dependent oxidoreductase [Streptomyces sp. NPDC003327]